MLSKDEQSVLVFSWHVPKGGLPKVLAEEGRALDSMGARDRVVVLDIGTPAGYRQSLADARVVLVPTRLHLPFPSSSRRTKTDSSESPRPSTPVILVSAVLNSLVALRRFRWRVVVCHEVLSAACSLPITFIRRTPYVVVLHDSPFLFIDRAAAEGLAKSPRERLAAFLVTRILTRASAVVCTTEAIRVQVQRYIPSDSLSVDDYGFTQDPNPSPYPLRDIVLAVAKWDRRRRPMIYVELGRYLPPGVNLVIAGRWETDKERRECEKGIHSLGLQDKVTVDADISEAKLEGLYRRAKLFVRFGFDEFGTGQGIVEAIGYGCPILTNTSLGGSSLIRQGVEGIVVPDTEVERAGPVMRAFLDSPATALAMHEACVALSVSRPWKSYVRDLIRVAVDAPLAGRAIG